MCRGREGGGLIQWQGSKGGKHWKGGMKGKEGGEGRGEERGR